jgi:hypothetical protein
VGATAHDTQYTRGQWDLLAFDPYYSSIVRVFPQHALYYNSAMWTAFYMSDP